MPLTDHGSVLSLCWAQQHSLTQTSGEDHVLAFLAWGGVLFRSVLPQREPGAALLEKVRRLGSLALRIHRSSSSDMRLAQNSGINLFDLCVIWLWENPKITIWMFILGCLLSRDLQTLDKSDLVPRTGGQTVPGRLGDDGSPAGSCRVMENFFSLPPRFTFTLFRNYRDSLRPH